MDGHLRMRRVGLRGQIFRTRGGPGAADSFVPVAVESRGGESFRNFFFEISPPSGAVDLVVSGSTPGFDVHLIKVYYSNFRYKAGQTVTVTNRGSEVTARNNRCEKFCGS